MYVTGVVNIGFVMLTFFVDQVTFEETKEADSTTRQATHRVSRGIHNKVFNKC